jgi:hypothetical protein
MEYAGEAGILLKAKELLASEVVGNSLLRKKATVISPLPVIDPGGKLHSWWVPLTAGDRLVAFFQFLENGSFMRFSTFQRHQDSFESCPLAKDWLDAGRIKEIAAVRIRKGEILQQPYLTYDNAPDRIALAVPVTDTNGKERIIYVANGYAYEKD